MADREPPATGWRRHRYLILVVLAVALAMTALAIFLTTRQQDLAEGTPVPPTLAPATPTVPPSTATPMPDEAALPAGSLPDLLRIAPDRMGESSGLPVQATYADLTRWLAHAGVDPATADASEIEAALAPLALPDVLAARGLDPQWQQLYGFDVRQVDQVLAVGQAPNLVLIMPGRYEAETLHATWVASGYQAVEVEETTVWSLVPGDRIDLSAPASRPALGLLNTIVLLDDGTLIATARLSHMAATLRVIQGDADSLYERDALRRAATTPAGIVATSAVIASGDLLRVPAPAAGTERPPEASPVAGATPTETPGSLPPVDLVLFTLNANGQVTMALAYDDPPSAATRIPARLRGAALADADWSSRYSLDAVLSRAGGAVVEVRFTPTAGAAGFAVVDQRELGPFTWSDE